MNGKLYIVSTPIGNYEDITLRALNILKSVDLVICEEYREGRRLLANYKIEKELTELNEHNEKEVVGPDLQSPVLSHIRPNWGRDCSLSLICPSHYFAAGLRRRPC